MQKKAKVILTINLILIFTLLSSLPLINAINVRDWNVGDSIIYGIRNVHKSSGEWINESIVNSFEYLNEFEYKISISSMDENNKTCTTKRKSPSGYTSEYTRIYGAKENGLILAQVLLEFNYRWDSSLNETILTGLYFDFDPFWKYGFPSLFLEPDWGTFNGEFVEILNTSRIIFAVIHNYTYHYIELSDFLDSTSSYKIMGEDTITNAQNAFTNDTTKWSFEFDLAGNIHHGIYDNVNNKVDYYPYDKYLISCEFEYSKGGILESYMEHIETYRSKENITYTSESDYFIQKGGLAGIGVDFEFYTIILTLMVLPMLITFLKKKKQ